MSDTVMHTKPAAANELAAVERVADPVSDFASSLGLGESTGWKLIREGKVRAIRIGRRTLITRAERDRYLQSLQVAS